jgi:signal transduction histidine kinase
VRLVLALSLVQAAVCLVGAIQTAIFTPGRAGVIFPALAIGAAAYVAAWTIARLGRVRAAAWITVVAQLAMPGAIVVGLGGDVNPMSTAAWSVFALLTANALLGSRGVLVVGAAAGAAATATLVGVGASAGPICEATLFVCCASGVMYAYARFRDGVEGDRAAVLRAKNRELESARGRLESRVAERTMEAARTSDELRHTADALIASRGALRNSERMAVVGRLSAGFAHELATPLGAIVASVAVAEALRTEYQQSIGDASVRPEDHRAIAAELASTLDTIKRATARATRFVRGIRTQLHQPATEAVEEFDARDVARQAADLVTYQAREAQVELVVDVADEDDLRLHGAPSRLQQALTNLLQNAVDALSSQGRGRVELRVRSVPSGIALSVSDDGPGIATDVLPRIFEPLFTTKACGKGTGIGLAIVQEVVNEMGAAIAVDSRLGHGTTFRIHVPRAHTSACA